MGYLATEDGTYPLDRTFLIDNFLEQRKNLENYYKPINRTFLQNIDLTTMDEPHREFFFRNSVKISLTIANQILKNNFLPSAIAICLNLTYPYKKESKLTLELKEILDNNDITRYDIWLSLVRSGIQIVECYEGITGYVKKQRLKESLLQVIEGLEGNDKKIVMGYYNNTLDPTISAIIDAWKAKSPNRKWCFMCF